MAEGMRKTTARPHCAHPFHRWAARILAALMLTAAALSGGPAPRAAAFPIEGDEQAPSLPTGDDPSEPEDGLQVSTIGFSVEGRPIEVTRFGQGPTARLIVAGIHGGSEANTTSLAEELVNYLARHAEAVPPGITLYILPLLNPDGAARATGSDGRTNAHGVDLNRNWPALWMPRWDRSGCWDLAPTTGGSGPASEPETMSLIQFISASKVDALISYHSAALGVFPGGQPPESRSLALAEALATVSDYPYPPVDTGCAFTGQLIDWAADNGIAAVDIELHNHRDTDLELNLAILRAFLDWES
ncbi:MAG: M14 family metallopeptidase [Chloroflexi bacterium]|nr:M14 family metallopeptidase [Chloroflexota bacterium]